MPRRLAWLVALPALVGCSERPRSGDLDSSPIILVLPLGADAEVEGLVQEAQSYLERVAGDVQVEHIETGDWRGVRAIGESSAAPVVLVFGASTFVPERIDAPRLEALGDSGFVLDAFEDGAWRASDGAFGSAFVLMDGNTRLARQYAMYESLRRFGVRFFHPEQEYVPAHAPGDLRPLALRPTALHRDGLDYIPDYASRSWSFHGAHPLEHLESFSDASVPIDEARNVNAWIVKNRGNRFRGAGRGVASEPSRAQRVEELEALRTEMGFPRGTGITLHNEQQGASAEIDPARPEPVQQQIEALVERKLADMPDAKWFGIHFGPTEFTTTPDQQTVRWIDWAGAKALELRPDIDVLINVHITGSQSMPNYDDQGCPQRADGDGRSDYYDLAFHTDRRLGASVHTVMFYPLEGPARVYNQQSFAHKLCLMERASSQGRPLQWFPEGSWWLSFDNSIPVYLPVYLWARERDVQLTKHLLASRGRGTLKSHRMFNSGHEWGYWQQDYGVGLWAWNVDVPMDAVLGEMFDPLCAPSQWQGCEARTDAVVVLEEIMEHQREFFLDREDWQGRPGGLFSYFAGEDQADEIAASSGFEFRPVRVSFTELAAWDEGSLAAFEASDIHALEEAAELNHAWADRLEALEGQVPATGRPWLAEVLDGIRINALRAEHTVALYRAAIEYRRTEIDGGEDPASGARPHYEAAADVLVEAEEVVRRREANYRYPAEQVYGGGLTPDTAQPNGTTYGYRVHTKTHLLTYWHNRQAQVAVVLGGGALGDAQAVRLEDALALQGSPLDLHWPDIEALDGQVSIGALDVSPQDAVVDLGPEVGAWLVDGTLEASGTPIHVAGQVVRAAVLGETGVGGLQLDEPAAPLAQTALAYVMPPMRWGWLSGEQALAIGYDPDENGSVVHEHVLVAPLATADPSGFATEPVLLEIPVERSGGSFLHIRVENAVLEGAVEGEALAEAMRISGQIRVDDLVTVLIEIGGFDEAGAVSTLSEILAFDPADPPVTVPLAGQFDVQPRP